MTLPLTATDLVAAARRRVVEVEPATFEANRGDAVLVDVREPSEFAAGHIARAVNIPRGVLEFQVDAHPALACTTSPVLARKDLPLVLVCRTGGRAALAAASLQDMGFGNVRSIAGGVVAWQGAGLPLV